MSQSNHTRMTTQAKDKALKQKIRIKGHYSTFRRPRELHQASLHLFYHYVPELIKYLYREPDHRLFGDREIRVGLAIKILHNTPSPAKYPPEVLEPVLNDIEHMLKDRHYLASIDQPNVRIKCLRNEFDLVQRYVDLDETVSLNAADDDPTIFETITNANANANATAQDENASNDSKYANKAKHADANETNQINQTDRDSGDDVDHAEGCLVM